MWITIITKEEITQKIFDGFKNNFAMSHLGCFLDEDVDALAAKSVVANLHGVPMIAHMSTRILSGVIAVNVEDFGMACSNAPGRLLADSTH